MVVLIVLAACSGSRAPEPTAAEPAQTTAISTTATVLLPATATTAAPMAPTSTPAPEVTVPDTAVEPAPVATNDAGYSRTPDGYYVRGQADAPVVIEDYSDFL
jgi:hypothetical protein